MTQQEILANASRNIGDREKRSYKAMTEHQRQLYANTVPKVEKEVKILNQYLADINRAFAYLQTEGKSDERKMHDLDGVVCQIKNLGEHMTRCATVFDVWRRRLDGDAINRRIRTKPPGDKSGGDFSPH